MPTGLKAVRPIAMAEILAARERIAGTAVRTPLIRLELGPGYPENRIKLEIRLPNNAYKLRGAANAVALLSAAERERGVWTISAGNAGQGVAYSARKAGVPCTVVVIETAPASKIERMFRMETPSSTRRLSTARSWPSEICFGSTSATKAG